MSVFYRRPRYFPPETLDVRIRVREQLGAEVVDTGRAGDLVPSIRDPALHDWAAERRAQPADILLPVARRWLQALPDLVRPLALSEQYPRLANHFAIAWGDRASVGLLFRELLADRRGGRRGFPAAVQSDLMMLWRYWNGLPAPQAPGSWHGRP